MLYLTFTTITSVDLAQNGVSRAKDWVSVDCGTSSKKKERKKKDSLAARNTPKSNENRRFGIVGRLTEHVVVLLFYVHGKHLRSCRDGQLT